LQVLAATSEESPGEEGLAALNTAVTAFPETVRVPQFGWNKVTAGETCKLLNDGYAYFANSFRMTEVPGGWSTASAEHGGAFIAAIESGGVLGCQFHPELSGAWGQALLGRWLAQENSAC
jgi:imidazole glycerol phosphate synthase glutamine amidotransferase subunit